MAPILEERFFTLIKPLWQKKLPGIIPIELGIPTMIKSGNEAIGSGDKNLITAPNTSLMAWTYRRYESVIRRH